MNVTGIKTDKSVAQTVTRQQSGDQTIKNLQSQIGELQKQLQQLSKGESGDEQSLAEKRKEIQQKIADLNAQIRQRQTELRQEKQQPKETSRQKSAPQGQARSKDGFSLSETSNLLAASDLLDRSKTVGGIIAGAEGRANILESEIKTDRARGADTSYKEKELAKVNKSIDGAKETQARLAADSGEVFKTERSEEKAAENEQEKKEDEIKTEGRYDGEGRLIEESDPEKSDYEDKA